jgi:Asp-tRNA(Asn)/Glu-tRNA(Gln) amidotransferase C subunit
MSTSRCLKVLKQVSNTRTSYFNYPTRAVSYAKRETDSCGIPLKPTWSVNELLESYPKPAISPATFKRLHELSALIPPEQGTAEHDNLKEELEDLIKLVEAVRLVKFDEEGGVPDGRVWADGAGIPLTEVKEGEMKDGRRLLQHAAHTADGFYLVEVDRKSK